MKKHSAIRHKTRLYVVGFAWSVLLTVTAYVTVTQELLVGRSALAFIFVIALLQVVVQLYFFLHIGDEAKPRWQLASLVCMLIILLIIVIGSIWIMDNLDYNMMPSGDMDAYMLQERDKGF